jgi:hypothetical protein
MAWSLKPPTQHHSHEKHIDNKCKIIIAKYILHVKTKLSMMLVTLDLNRIFET